MRQKPLLLIDIDGVISLFGAPAPWPAQAGSRSTNGANTPTAGPAQPAMSPPVEGSLHTIEGIPHFLSRTAAAHLHELSAEFELVWASGWEERADEHLPHLLGLPSGLPHLRLKRHTGTGGIRTRNAHWKLEAIDAYAPTRALAWVDDTFNDACHEWAAGRAARTAPTLLIQTDPARGLTTTETRQLLAWARGD